MCMLVITYIYGGTLVPSSTYFQLCRFLPYMAGSNQ
uniref:Uncharacterized protein n=1 Tax=Arundo donax TaxID=35708 RepID=A0A0A9A839_ARUDO